MWDRLQWWFEQRAARRRRWQNDARTLAALGEPTAYCEAQRRAARARAQGHRREFLHWARVAAEVARIAPLAEMDIDVVQSIVDAELREHRSHPR